MTRLGSVTPQCLVEAVLVLDVLCRQEPSFLYRALACLKALHARLGADPGPDPGSECTLLPLAQFFLSHGERGPRPREGQDTLRCSSQVLLPGPGP